MPDTLLVISGPGIAPYSARGLTQTLDPIAAGGVFARDVNGTLINLSPPTGFARYVSKITCTDVEAPAFDNVQKGDVLTVDCVVELGYNTSTGSPARTVVPGSSRVVGGYTYYRPRLTMMVTDFTNSRDEYGHLTAWSLDLEEV